MKTDAELNRLIAEHVTKPKKHLMGKDWNEIGIATSFHWTYPVIDYCTDPAAWGALFVRLAEFGCTPLIEHDGLGSYTATVKGDGRVIDLPGRALVLATLAAYGVEVDE
jgi:hypothetical protein